jgi:quinol-cytochrome oxidoreductase complex cytochrome b subunit
MSQPGYLSRKEEKRAAFQRYKEDVAREGKPFFPFQTFHDSVMALVVVLTIIGLAIVWKYSIPDGSDGTEPGLVGPLYAE